MIGLSIAGMIFTFVGLVCFLFILLHAFQRSLGTGFMVLLIPIYTFYYAFSQFEHRAKGLIITGFLGFPLLGIVFRVIAMQLALPPGVPAAPA
jgi:hypothetical protein